MYYNILEYEKCTRIYHDLLPYIWVDCYYLGGRARGPVDCPRGTVSEGGVKSVEAPVDLTVRVQVP